MTDCDSYTVTKVFKAFSLSLIFHLSSEYYHQYFFPHIESQFIPRVREHTTLLYKQLLKIMYIIPIF
jgi:hypothetical protein